MAPAIQMNHCSRCIQAFMASPYPVARSQRQALRHLPAARVGKSPPRQPESDRA
jgi:hypothetical protein